jgi:RNA polymerase sigma factor (sigma-70 family)
MPGSPVSQLIEHLRRTALPRYGAGLTDGQLLGRFVQARDEAAFEALLRRHGPMVWGVCRRIVGHAQDAEDAFQATFVVLVRKAAAVVPREAVGNWLYGVAYHTALKARAVSAKRRGREIPVDALPEPGTAGPDLRDERLRLLDQELSRLPDKYRLPIVLCDLEGRPRREVAGQLRLPEGTLSSRLTTARRTLAKRLARHGLILPAGALGALLAEGAASAGVPPTLAASTVKAGGLLATGKAAGELVSARAAALAEGMVKLMFLSQLKTVPALLFGLLAAAVAAGTLAYQPLLAGGSQAKRADSPPAKASNAPAAKPRPAPSRARQFQALQAEYRTELDKILTAIRAGKLKQDQDGGYVELVDLRKRFAKRARRLLDADPKDAVALDVILFSLRDLVADWDDPKLYDLLAAHHLHSPKLAEVISRPSAGESFLRTVAAKSPHAQGRARAILALATLLARRDRAREAEALLLPIIRDKQLAKLNHHHGNLGKGAADLLFEIRHLSVGKTAPEIESVDMDDKPLKLSDYRGKVVLLVFWATWCGPCMALVPHERELAKRYAGRPFAVVGVNGDGDIIYGKDGKPIDQKARVKARMKREGIAWRSFRDFLIKEKVQVSRRWNVDSWPTLYVLDHRGVIRHKFIGAPGKEVLDRAVAKLVAAAERKRSRER